MWYQIINSSFFVKENYLNQFIQEPVMPKQVFIHHTTWLEHTPGSKKTQNIQYLVAFHVSHFSAKASPVSFHTSLFCAIPDHVYPTNMIRSLGSQRLLNLITSATEETGMS